MYNLMLENKVDVITRANIIMSVCMVNNIIIRSGVVVSVAVKLAEYKEVSN